MKFLLAAFVIISALALSYISIHAYEDTYMLECDINEDIREGLIEEVYELTVSSHPEAASGVFGKQTVAGALMQRRDLEVPAWATAK